MKVDNDNNITEVDDLSKIETTHWTVQIGSIGRCTWLQNAFLRLIRGVDMLRGIDMPTELVKVVEIWDDIVRIQKCVVQQLEGPPGSVPLEDFIANWTPATQSELDELAIKEIIE